MCHGTARTWALELKTIEDTPAHLRSPQERAAVESAARIRAVAVELRRPSCSCCMESVMQMEQAAALLEEIVGR